MSDNDTVDGITMMLGCCVGLIYLAFTGLIFTGLFLGVKWLWLNV